MIPLLQRAKLFNIIIKTCSSSQKRFYSSPYTTETRTRSNRLVIPVLVTALGTYLLLEVSNKNKSIAKPNQNHMNEMKELKQELKQVKEYAKHERNKLSQQLSTLELQTTKVLYDYHSMISHLQTKVYPEKRSFDEKWDPFIEQRDSIPIRTSDIMMVRCFDQEWNLQFEDDQFTIELKDSDHKNYYLVVNARLNWKEKSTFDQQDQKITRDQLPNETLEVFNIYPNTPITRKLPVKTGDRLLPEKITLSLAAAMWFPDEASADKSKKAQKSVDILKDISTRIYS